MSLDNSVKDLGGNVVKSSVGLAHEFKEFISRGNVVDLAVGVIIGGAFGNIVTSFVKDLIMPPVGWLTSGHDLSGQALSLPPVTVPDLLHPGAMITKPAVIIPYGDFLNTVLSFLIISFAIFWMVKGVNLLKRKEAAKPVDPPVPSPQEKLLIEIRDLLARGK
jgi:large conductance mechanosensitive channel